MLNHFVNYKDFFPIYKLYIKLSKIKNYLISKIIDFKTIFQNLIDIK